MFRLVTFTLMRLNVKVQRSVHIPNYITSLVMEQRSSFRSLRRDFDRLDA